MNVHTLQKHNEPTSESLTSTGWFHCPDMPIKGSQNTMLFYVDTYCKNIHVFGLFKLNTNCILMYYEDWVGLGLYCLNLLKCPCLSDTWGRCFVRTHEKLVITAALTSVHKKSFSILHNFRYILDEQAVSLYGASPYCLFPGCIVTWAWSLAKGQYMVSWLLTGAPEQRYWQNRETANIWLVSSVGRAPARQSGGRRFKSRSCHFFFVHPKCI